MIDWNVDTGKLSHQQIYIKLEYREWELN